MMVVWLLKMKRQWTEMLMTLMLLLHAKKRDRKQRVSINGAYVKFYFQPKCVEMNEECILPHMKSFNCVTNTLRHGGVI